MAFAKHVSLGAVACLFFVSASPVPQKVQSPKPSPTASAAPSPSSVPSSSPAAKSKVSPLPSPKPLSINRKKGALVHVVINSNKGSIKLELDKEKAPLTVENFLQYVNSKHFDGTIFHRVIGGFMIQGGGFDAEMKQRSTQKPIKIESNNGLKNARGSIAMARTNDPNSATAQFFINLSDNEFLNYQSDSNPGYAVFGRVIEGLDVVDEIAKTKTGNKGMHADVPLQPIVLETVTALD
jgi:cyclophilin family peptidyl-prolyl cis-trans isomerase